MRHRLVLQPADPPHPRRRGQQVSRCRRIASVDVFWTLMLISTAAVPLSLILRQSSSEAIGPVRH
jgi:hypothetical protein